MHTADSYQIHFEQLRARYERERGSWDWSAFIDWLIDRRTTLRPASFRKYRSAVVSVLQQQGGLWAAVLWERLRHEGKAARRCDLPRRTAAGKAKSLSSEDQHRLMMWLRGHRGKWDALTEDWLFWSIQTGLRPVEWRDATLHMHTSPVALNVRNARRSNGRAHGDFRTVHLQVDTEAMQALQAFMRRVQCDFDFDAAYQGCRRALHRAAHALWPRRHHHPTLYTGRHQFAANAKASGLAPEAVAALMGHAVTETHQTHYGKRRCGRGELFAMADARDVQRVLDRMQTRAHVKASGVAPVPGVGARSS